MAPDTRSFREFTAERFTRSPQTEKNNYRSIQGLSNGLNEIKFHSKSPLQSWDLPWTPAPTALNLNRITIHFERFHIRFKLMDVTFFVRKESEKCWTITARCLCLLPLIDHLLGRRGSLFCGPIVSVNKRVAISSISSSASSFLFGGGCTQRKHNEPTTSDAQRVADGTRRWSVRPNKAAHAFLLSSDIFRNVYKRIWSSTNPINESIKYLFKFQIISMNFFL